MTSEEFRAGRIELGLSIADAGRIWGTETDRIRRWETKAKRGRDIPGPAAQLMRVLLAHPHVMAALR